MKERLPWWWTHVEFEWFGSKKRIQAVQRQWNGVNEFIKVWYCIATTPNKLHSYTLKFTQNIWGKYSKTHSEIRYIFRAVQGTAAMSGAERDKKHL